MKATDFIKTEGVDAAHTVVKEALKGATYYGDNNGNPLYYKFEDDYWWFFSESLNDWATSSINYGDKNILETLVEILDLKKALYAIEKIESYSTIKRNGLAQAKAHREYLISYGSEFAGVSTGEIESLTEWIDIYTAIFIPEQISAAQFIKENSMEHVKSVIEWYEAISPQYGLGPVVNVAGVFVNVEEVRHVIYSIEQIEALANFRFKTVGNGFARAKHILQQAPIDAEVWSRKNNLYFKNPSHCYDATKSEWVEMDRSVEPELYKGFTSIAKLKQWVNDYISVRGEGNEPANKI
ncbi:hypothetical protein QDS01_18010 [Acinetobacter nosocomialis]|uniref:hypothetical protein n=1 Tax=Acinetobacter nosocomialis TaxID=106654 RepID=UPI00244856B1|nr:hypothetical protein [Acinetobacter nosocomialis]MDH2636807.1 hypothetical protein [Acinetobacter nosocomialis]